MRLVTYAKNGTEGVAVRDGELWRDLGAVSMIDMISGEGPGKAGDLSQYPQINLDDVTLLPPVPLPPKVICVGLNYLDHLDESPYDEVPKYPAFFPRYNSSLLPDGGTIVRPVLSEQLDFEAELAVIIGKPGRNIKEEDALEHVAGYSAFNDGSLRDYQFITAQWTVGKNFDATGGFGPELVTPDELPEGAKGLSVECLLNGEVMQSGNTNEMIFTVAQLIAFASKTMTLETGTLIATGTPAGIGWSRTPPRWMVDGDEVEIRIEGIAPLRNTVKDEVRA
jgi:2-keto-4-pentenoate hydratase/2-oxohepta-3-ene-1,7-dioic acid hydratase in catechol pathway